MSTYYRIDIAAAGLGGAAPADGFIDNKTIEKYIAEGSSPDGAGQTLAKERANIRYAFMIGTLGQMCNAYVSDIVATGGTAKAAPSTFSFTVAIEHNDGALTTANESSPGTYLSGVAALKRAIARSLLISRSTYSQYPDDVETDGSERKMHFDPVVVGALTASLSTAEAAITVTPSPTLADLSISANKVKAAAAAGVLVGAIQGKTASSTLSLVENDNTRFALSGTNINTGATATSATGYRTRQITVRETLTGASNSPHDTVLTIYVID